MKCPRCGSENITHSHRRGLEKVLRFVYPRIPYRCKECWTRFWRFENPLQSIGGKITALLIILLIGAGVSYLMWFRGHGEPPVAEKGGNKFSVQDEKSESVKKSISESPEKMPIFPEEKPFQISENQPFQSETKTESPPATVFEYNIPPSAPVKVQENKPVAAKMTPQSAPVRNPVAENKFSVKITDKAEIVPSAESAPKTAQVPASEKNMPMVLKDIRSQSSDGSFSMVLSANAPIEKYKTIALNPPPKLVLDLPGKWNYSGRSSIYVDSDLVERIRIGEHPNKLRLVIDLKGSRTYSPRVEQSPDGLTFTIKK